MRIITGDECGLLKDIIPDINTNRSPIDNSRISSTTTQSSIITSSNGSTQGLSMNRSHGVVGLAFCPQINNLAFCALRLDGTIERWEGSTGSKGSSEDFQQSHTTSYIKTHSWDHILRTKLEGDLDPVERPIGICSSQRYQNSSPGSKDCTIACCTSMGYVTVFRLSPDLNGISTYEPYGKLSDTPKITYTKGKFLNKDLATSMAMDYDGERLAVGGRERETVIVDVNTGTVMWKVWMTFCKYI